MNSHAFDFFGTTLTALPSGALWWAAQQVLVVSDLHFGKAARLATEGGALLPPYETRETLARLSEDLEACNPAHVICLGDSFDTAEIEEELPEAEKLWIVKLQAGRAWTWIEGNHDPGPVNLGGTHRAELTLGPLRFRHIADPASKAEISGHYHPKARLSARGRSFSQACFLVDSQRLILPAYGAYTGGLTTTSAVLSELMGPEAQAILTGRRVVAVPMPRKKG